MLSKTLMTFVVNRHSCYVVRDDIRTCDVTKDDAISQPNLLIWQRISYLVTSQNLMIIIIYVSTCVVTRDDACAQSDTTSYDLFIYYIFIFTCIHNIFINNSRQIKMQLKSRQWNREIVVHHCLSLLPENYAHSYLK